MIADNHLVAIAADGLPTRCVPPSRVAAPVEATRLLTAVRRARLTGAYAAMIRDGRWPAEDATRDAAFAAHREAMATDLRLEALLLEVADALHTVGVAFRVLKGAASAHLLYTDPALRSSSDVDLLVPGASFGRAREVVERLGGVRHYPEPRPGFDERFSKGASFTVPDGFEVDLHRTLAPGAYGLLVPTDELFAEQQTFVLAGTDLPALDAEAATLHACLHAVLGGPRPSLGPLRDLGRLLARPGVDADLLRERAERWQAASVVAYAVTACWGLFDLEGEPDVVAWARAHRPTGTDRRRLSPYRGDDRSSAAMALGAFRAVSGARSKAAYAMSVAVPLAARRSRVDRWRRGVATLRRSAAGGSP